MRLYFLSLLFSVLSCVASGAVSRASELWIGTGTVSITPDKPVALAGQTITRIAREASGPCMATAVAIESRQDNKTLDHAILVSCDLIGIRGFEGRLRESIAKRLPDLDVKKILLNATHTHTAPVLQEGKYDIPPDAMRATEYIEFLVDRVCDLVVKTWQSRRPGGGVSWGLGHAVVGNHRRMVYADGSAVMYGKTNIDTFRRVEGREDHGVEVLFFWDKNKRLLAVAVNVACPSQEVGMGKAVSADFWHEVRLGLRKKYGKNVQVLAWTGASGDQAPKLLWRTEAEERMRKGRGLTRLEEIARRIVHAVDEAHEVAKKDIRFTNVPLVHVVKEIDLPPRMLTDKEYAKMKAEYEKLVKANSTNRARMSQLKMFLNRYESPENVKPHRMKMHVIRLGDVAIATNPFELFIDYGIQMKARSKALQTFVIQLVGPGRYLPTAEAVEAGGYSTDPIRSNSVGPEGGQVLVDRTVEEINKLWKK